MTQLSFQFPLLRDDDHDDYDGDDDDLHDGDDDVFHDGDGDDQMIMVIVIHFVDARKDI